MAKGIFITAVGTDIGKTTVSCILIKLLKKRGIDCGVMKPVQCAGNDAEILMRASCVKDGKVLVNPFFLKHSYAPLLAFKKEGIKFRKKIVLDSFEKLSNLHQFMLVEGAGGLLVPLTKDYFISDLAADLGLPLVIVADVGLGAINHTLLTIEHAKNKGLKIAGLIFNTRGPRPGVVESTNPGIIKSISNIPVLGVVPHNNFRNIKIMLDGIINA